MSDFNLIFGFIPENAYKYIVMVLLGLLIFRQKIPILNKIDVTIRLPEEFMRNFRWITPLLILGLYFWAIVFYVQASRIYQNINLIQQQLSLMEQLLTKK